MNGPGVRNVLHVQGCSIHCPGCFNPKTWEFSPSARDINEVIGELLGGDPDGITISGGEPLDQWDAVKIIAGTIRTACVDRTVWMFSGYTVEEIIEKGYYGQLADCVDVLIAGPFVEEQRINTGIKGSINQTVVPFTSRGMVEAKSYRPGSTEILVDEQGNVKITGFPTKELVEKAKRELT